MRFLSIAVTNLRCFADIEYHPGEGNNLICGENGSGKTTLLEAFAISSVGRSFLTNRTSELVKSGAMGFSVSAEAVFRSGGAFLDGVTTVFVRRTHAESVITMNGKAVASASALARSAPLLAINSKAPDLLSESPSNRRALVDRTLFHVKQDYVVIWKGYRHALQQRNEILRRCAPSQVHYWNEKLAAYGEMIDEQRRRVVAAINDNLASLNEGTFPFSFDYHSGYHGQGNLLRELQDSWGRDVGLGHTIAGPHRADLTLRQSGKPIAKRLSRGQSKYIACAAIVGLARFIKTQLGTPPVLLIDDLAAELDDRVRGKTIEMLGSLDAQCIYTAIRPSDLPELMSNEINVFHVEHQAPKSKVIRSSD